MSNRASSLNRADSGISRVIGSNYESVLKVGQHIDEVIKVASVDLVALAAAITEATDFEGISVVAGDTAGWDPVNKVITVPAVNLFTRDSECKFSSACSFYFNYIAYIYCR